MRNSTNQRGLERRCRAALPRMKALQTAQPPIRRRAPCASKPQAALLQDHHHIPTLSTPRLLPVCWKTSRVFRASIALAFAYK